MISDLINTVVSFEKGIDSMRLFGVRTKTKKKERRILKRVLKTGDDSFGVDR